MGMGVAVEGKWGGQMSRKRRTRAKEGNLSTPRLMRESTPMGRRREETAAMQPTAAVTADRAKMVTGMKARVAVAAAKASPMRATNGSNRQTGGRNLGVDLRRVGTAGEMRGGGV